MGSPPLPRRPAWHSEHHGNDLDEAREFFARSYNGSGFRAELTSAPFAWRYTTTGQGPVSLHSASFLGDVRGTVAPEGVYVALWLTEGRGLLDLGREEDRLALGRPAMFPTGRPFGFEAHEYRNALVHFDAAYLEKVAAEVHGTVPGPIRFSARVRDTTAWWAAVRGLRDTLAAVPAPTPLQRDTASRRAAVAALQTFAHRVAPLPSTPPSVSARRLRRAVEFVHANADLPLGVSDIAEAAGLTVRGLQLAFRRAFDQTPLHYLREVRLDRARDDLSQGDRSSLEVGEVAARWGFVSGGRFAQHYARRFGERPSDTLRR